MSPTRMSKIESAIRTVLDFTEAFNSHDVRGMEGFISDDCVFESSHPPPDGTRHSGKDEISQFWKDFFHESPQAHIQIEEIFSLGERCIMRWRYTWVDAEGGKAHLRGVDIFQVRRGSIREKLSYIKG